MGSRHGTFVNGEKTLKHELQPKDRVDFGMADSYKLLFLGEGATIEELVERVEAPAPQHAGRASCTIWACCWKWRERWARGFRWRMC